MKENFELLESRLADLSRGRDLLQKDYNELSQQNRNRVATMNELKPELKRVYQLREQYRK